jgi:hypothetical protein
MAMYRELGYEHGVWADLFNTGLLEIRRGKLERREELLRECWRITREEDNVGLAYMLSAAAVLVAAKGNERLAARLHGAATVQLDPSDSPSIRYSKGTGQPRAATA